MQDNKYNQPGNFDYSHGALVTTKEQFREIMRERNRIKYGKIPLSNETLLEVVTKGTKYKPAWKHYGEKTVVVCDKCYEDDIEESFGWEKYDLCVSCYNEIKKE